MAEWTKDQIIARIRGEADKQKVDPDLAVAVATQESYLNPNAKGDNGKSLGLFQLQPAAAIDVGVNPQWRQDPDVNIYGGVRYLKQKLAQSQGDIPQALKRYNGRGDPNYVQNVMRFYKPGVAEAAERPQAGTYSDADVQNALKALQGPQEQAQPQADTYSDEDVQNALRALQGTQEPGTAPQTAPAPTTHPGASQASPEPPPDPTATPGMRFQALPSISRLEPADRMQKTKLFESLKPEMQEEFLRSEEPPSDLTVEIAKPSTSRAPADLEEALTRELAPAQKYAPLVLGGAAAGSLGRMTGGYLAGKLGHLGTALPLIGEGLANLGFRKGAVAAGQEEPGLLGDVTAAAAPAVLGAVAPVVAKVGNALRSVVKPAHQAVVDLGKKYDIRLSYGDVTAGGAAPEVEAFLEGVPGSGAGRMRVGQQADVTKAGEAIQAGLKTEMQQTPWRDLKSVQHAASGTGPRAKEAQVLLSEISEAGDDWGRVIQTSGKVNLFQDRVRAEKLYNKVEELAQPLGNMRLPKATQAIDDAIARASDDVLPSPEVKREVIGALNRIKGEISPSAAQPQPSMATRNPLTGSLQAQPVTQATNVPDTTYTRMRRLRSSLGDLQREAAEPATARYLSGVKTALEEDMAEFAAKSNVPELATAAKRADDFYRTRIVPYREGALAKAIEKNLPDEIYNQFVRRGKDRAEYFYKGLDAKGQAAVRYGMVEEAIEKANSGAPDVFSPQRFATSLKKIQDAHGVFFKGTPQWEINGITKVMEHAKRAGQYAENPPTGLRGNLGTMILGGGIFGPLKLAQAVLTGQGLRTMLMTQSGRNFLLAASDMQPGSSAFQKRLEAFLRTLPAGAAGAGAAVRAQEETVAR